MVRNDITGTASPGCPILALSPGHGVTLQWNKSGDGQVDSNIETDGTTVYPAWLKLVRSGATFTGSGLRSGRACPAPTTRRPRRKSGRRGGVRASAEVRLDARTGRRGRREGPGEVCPDGRRPTLVTRSPDDPTTWTVLCPRDVSHPARPHGSAIRDIPAARHPNPPRRPFHGCPARYALTSSGVRTGG
ncbi:hypothetical protein OG496_49630 [Streptomyces sp. NBC_00988]|uniref:hypothetical protein n=1 Tax=Streptomyces sp. NBC_00988 TaxID=2903704 RepID=UPI00386BB8E9|nr:hypothetical protein OG496_49630 [Streptomyces sp. NBC_00988]